MKHQGFRSRILSHLFIFNNFWGFIKNLCQYSLTIFFKVTESPRHQDTKSMSQGSEFRVQSSEFSVSVSVQTSAVPEPVEGKARHFLQFLYPSYPQFLTPNQKNVSMCFYFLQDTLTRLYKKFKISKSQNLRNLETQQLSDSVSWRLGDLVSQ